jgi:hypothetical protein
MAKNPYIKNRKPGTSIKVDTSSNTRIYSPIPYEHNLVEIYGFDIF